MQDIKIAKKIAVWAPSQTLSGYIFATKARIDNRKAAISPQHVPTICWTSTH